MSPKYLYFFGAGKSEGRAEMKNLLGGKGANLCEMASLGLPVPAGFVITTEVCTYYYQNGKKLPADLDKDIRVYMLRVEKVMGAKFGDAKNPLLVSVRSGARASMPGMMETVLNLGLNEQTLQGVIEKTQNERFAWDLYRRFVHMFSKVVMEIEDELFGRRLDQMKKEAGVKLDTELNAAQLKQLTHDYKAIYQKHVGKPFPTDPWEQMRLSIGAVFQSWNKKKAIDYRKINNIPDWWGTAVNICSMVYGNMGDDCATGVAFTRDPATGDRRFFGEWLKNAQGEDVVAGIRTPQPINESSRSSDDKGLPTLEAEMPVCYKELVRIYTLLEKHYKDMQDIEFTIQNGRLWMLQTRNGKRTAQAAIRIAVDLQKEGFISPSTAVKRVDPEQLDQLLHPMFDPKAKKTKIAKGINASPGAAVGQVVFTAEHAVDWALNGKKVILVRLETSPEDVAGMHAAQGILTARGGKTSHAAVVARGMGKCCVCGAGDIHIDEHASQFTVGDVVVKEGDYISLDGSKGEAYLGQVPVIDSEIIQVLKGQIDPKDSVLYQYYDLFMKWVDQNRKMAVRTNADTPEDSHMAVLFGAQGIGLTRTEHMFFDTERILHVRRMILADSKEKRKEALSKIIGYQREDFYGIFKEMAGRPVTIRLLDPPLHEFLPAETDREKVAEVAKELGVEPAAVEYKIVSLHEFNPMLGHRGCRLGIVFPEITEMQARAIFEAAVQIKKEGGKVLPEVMVPLTGTIEEMQNQKTIIVDVAKQVMKEQNMKFNYMVGTMIEIPRAAIVADEIAKEAEFFSFGTNDLTQMTFGYSRDDAGKFLPYYVDNKILPGDPFGSLDQIGVGALMKMGVERGRSTRPDLKCGICGEHGGDPASVKFCHKIGLNYVSCSPYRVPIARLAAAQAAVEEKEMTQMAVKKAAAKPAAKKAVKKAAPKKAAAKKAAPKKAAVKKAAPKKAAAKKAAPKKAAPKKAAPKAKAKK